MLFLALITGLGVAAGYTVRQVSQARKDAPPGASDGPARRRAKRLQRAGNTQAPRGRSNGVVG